MRCQWQTPKLLPHRSRMGTQQRHFVHLHRVHARLVIPIRSRLVTMAFLNALLGMRVKDITWKSRVRSLRFACNLRDSKRCRIRASSSRAKAANPEEVRVLLGTRRKKKPLFNGASSGRADMSSFNDSVIEKKAAQGNPYAIHHIDMYSGVGCS